jgi:endoglucanase Acf2
MKWNNTIMQKTQYGTYKKISIQQIFNIHMIEVTLTSAKFTRSRFVRHKSSNFINDNTNKKKQEYKAI